MFCKTHMNPLPWCFLRSKAPAKSFVVKPPTCAKALSSARLAAVRCGRIGEEPRKMSCWQRNINPWTQYINAYKTQTFPVAEACSACSNPFALCIPWAFELSQESKRRHRWRASLATAWCLRTSSCWALETLRAAETFGTSLGRFFFFWMEASCEVFVFWIGIYLSIFYIRVSIFFPDGLSEFFH